MLIELLWRVKLIQAMQTKKAEVKEKEVTKEEFKALYFKYATPDSGWTKDYWNEFFEKEKGKKYFFSKPEPGATRMFIITTGVKRRMVFFSEDAEESFFDNPGKE